LAWLLIAPYLEGFQQFTQFSLIDFSIRPPFLMGIPLVHHFHTKTGSVKNVGPSIQDMALIIHDGLVKIETIALVP
jgi:hypothetical protein